MRPHGLAEFGRSAAALLALVLCLAWPAAAQEDGQSGGFAPKAQTGIRVQADSSGALIPEVQRPPQDPQGDSNGPMSGGFAPRTGGQQAGGKAPVAGGGSSGGFDYAAWERMASRAETAIEDVDATEEALDDVRDQLVFWRQTALDAQTTNIARITTLREQIEALGPAPEEGVTEDKDIASRRETLTKQLARLQAPGITAEEAYRRADGLIGEMDRVLRSRKTNELRKLWPNPLNPGNWPDALAALSQAMGKLWAESSTRWQAPQTVRNLVDNLPVILPLLVFSIAILWRGRRWSDRLIGMLQGPASLRGRRVWNFAASLTLILVPTLGFIALSEALLRTRLLGTLGSSLAEILGQVSLIIFAAVWLGMRAFPVSEQAPGIIALGPEDRARGRVLTSGFGVLLAIVRIERIVIDAVEVPDTAWSVLNLPLILVGAVMLLRMGLLIRTAYLGQAGEDQRGNYRARIGLLVARATIAAAVVGAVLAVIGFIGAASALVFPAAQSLGLAAALMLAYRLIGDLYGLVMGREGAESDALAPVLISFALTLATVPLFALLWGARKSDLTELWARFQEGFRLGESTISPTDFLFFAVVFGIGWSLTRLLQGAMKTQILPRTGLDQGGQNAVVSGLGYVGIFVSALIAINSTGIDLSGLAIVAGALSVGIGFGLQTVVSNFVSGIILLIERPVSEGDWIEVGPVQGIVSSISVRSTRIQTFDRSDVIVPNSDLITGRVTNWTRFSLTGRLVLAVPVPFTTDTRKVERILREIAEAQPLVLLSPPPIIALINIAAEVMTFEIRVILRDVNFIVEVRSEINHQIVKRFEEEGIVFSNAHRDYLKRLADEAAAEAEKEAEWQEHQAAVAALLGPGERKT